MRTFMYSLVLQTSCFIGSCSARMTPKTRSRCAGLISPRLHEICATDDGVMRSVLHT